MKRIWLVAAASAAVVASTAGYMAFATQHKAAPKAAQDSVEVLKLAAQPEGSVTLGRDQQGDLTATLNVTGLTPTLAHAVDLDVAGKAVATFTNLTADGVGADNNVTVTSTFKGAVPNAAHVVLRLSNTTDAQSQEPVAISGAAVVGRNANLAAVDVDQNGKNEGALTANAVLDFNAQAQTLKITLNATGLTPGAHAAHIHAGTCQAQGAILLMMNDFMANANGDVVNQSRTITGVTSAPTAGQSYLNLHMGNMNQLLDANGNPLPTFRPLLCAND